MPRKKKDGTTKTIERTVSVNETAKETRAKNREAQSAKPKRPNFHVTQKGEVGHNSKYATYHDDILEYIRQYGFQTYGGATRTELCNYFGISQTTFDNFRLHHPEFRGEIEEARNYYKENLTRIATRGLIMLLRGGVEKETVTEYRPGKDGQPEISKQTVREKTKAPDFNAIQMVLQNLAGDEWKNKSTQDIVGTLQLAQITGMRIIDESEDSAGGRMSETNELEAEDTDTEKNASAGEKRDAPNDTDKGNEMEEYE